MQVPFQTSWEAPGSVLDPVLLLSAAQRRDIHLLNASTGQVGCLVWFGLCLVYFYLSIGRILLDLAVNGLVGFGQRKWTRVHLYRLSFRSTKRHLNCYIRQNALRHHLHFVNETLRCRPIGRLCSNVVNTTASIVAVNTRVGVPKPQNHVRRRLHSFARPVLDSCNRLQKTA